jgi:hypothetical protein
LQELVWESVAILNRQLYTEIPIVFEDVRFHRATNLPEEGKYHGAVVQSFMIALMYVDYWSVFCPKITSRDSLFQYKIFP